MLTLVIPVIGSTLGSDWVHRARKDIGGANHETNRGRGDQWCVASDKPYIKNGNA